MKETINVQWRIICKLFDQNIPQFQIAEAVGLSRGRVCQILKVYRKEGKVPVYTGGNRGYKSRLTAEDKDRLTSLLSQGPASFGFQGEVWTLKRVQALIKQEFDVDYCSSHMSNLLSELNWTRQKFKKRLPAGPGS